jgi:hypothetical protein
MKMKRWLSRGIVLAMVVALMIPVPAAAKAKSSSGGKLVKSATYYEYDLGKDGKYGTADDKYVVTSKRSFTYDKKGNPTEIKTAWYGDHFLGIPTNATLDVQTLKYKYKGSKAKSMTQSNEAGFVTDSRKYTNGRVTSFSGNYGVYSSVWVENDPETGMTLKEVGENSRKTNGTIAYDKAGLVTAESYAWTSVTNGAIAASGVSNAAFYVVQSKGIPSYMYQSAGNWTITENGKTTTYDYSVDGGSYASFNSKGLLTQEGYYNKKDNKFNAYGVVQYVMKKGTVAEAIIFDVNSMTGKQIPVGKYVFEYNKTKVSKQRYMNMINSFVSDEFDWFWY